MVIEIISYLVISRISLYIPSMSTPGELASSLWGKRGLYVLNFLRIIKFSTVRKACSPTATNAFPARVPGPHSVLELQPVATEEEEEEVFAKEMGDNANLGWVKDMG